MAIKDIEDLLRSLKTYLKANLNTEIGLVNTEKTDFDIPTLPADDLHYWIAGEMGDLPNRDFCIVGLIDNVPSEANYDDIRYEIPIDIRVVFAQSNHDTDYFKALRYARALTNAVLDYQSDSNPEIQGVQITNIIPMLLEIEKRRLITTGITVNIPLA